MPGSHRDLIQHCPVAFQKVCPKLWRDLRQTSEENVRFCDTCQRPVFYCEGDAALIEHARQGHCIATPSRDAPAEADEPIPFLMGHVALTPPTHDIARQQAEDQQFYSEARKQRALKDIWHASRTCPTCHFPCVDSLTECRVCGTHVGLALPPEIERDHADSAADPPPPPL